ncbi:MAG: hypothetical protein V1872_00065 [bacterium]
MIKNKVTGLLPIKIISFFLFTLIIYNLNGRIIYTNDSTPANFLPLSIIKEFNLDLNEFPFLYKDQLSYFLSSYKGHLYSNYSVITSILAVPVYLVPYYTGRIRDIPDVLFLAKLSASILASLSVIFLLLAVLKLTNSEFKAFFIASLYALATSTWTISGQALWEHTSGQFFLAAALLFIVLVKDNLKHFYIAGIFSALACVSRLNNTILVICFTVFIVMRYKRRSWRFFIFPIIIAIWHFTLNFLYFGSFLGGTGVLTRQAIFRQHVKGGFNGDILKGFLGILISPSRGLLIFSPWLIFCFLGIVLVWIKGYDLLFKCVSIGIVGTVLLFSKFTTWWGGLCYGPRYLVDMLPLLSIFTIFIIDEIRRRKIMAIIFGILIIYSIGIQLIGAFFYSGDWYYSPTNVDHDHERLWDWNNNEIIYSLKNGVQQPIFLPHLPSLFLQD